MLIDQVGFGGRVAIVTGGGQGLGAAHCHLLARRGAVVVINDRPDSGAAVGRSTRAETIADEIIAAGGKAFAVGGDVTSKEAMDAVVAETLERFGRIDIVISNAGTAGYVTFADMTLDLFDRMLRIHVHGSFLIAHAAWPHMVARGYGRIVMTGSSGMFGLENQAHYAAAKGGVAGLVKALSIDGQSAGIFVNGILPFADTPLARSVSSTSTIGADSAKTTAALASLSAGPELVSPIVAWLVHEDCQVTGELFQAGMGRACRIVTAHGSGYSDPVMTIESVRDNWAEIDRSDAQGEFRDLNAALTFQVNGQLG